MRGSRTKRIFLAVIVVFVAAQFVPLNRQNPPVTPSKTIEAVEPMPASVRAIFQTSCNDCHSNETRWPWYSRIAPLSWMIVHDVHEGRRHVNFSEWGVYSAKKKEDKLELICEQVTNGDMPDGVYAFFHRQVRVGEQGRQEVCDWVDSARSTLEPD